MNNIRMFVFFMGVVLSLGAQNDPSKDFIAKALTDKVPKSAFK